MTFLEDRDFEELPTIPEYFKGKTIFITGGSGFIGKVLIEKLLFSCSELDKMYILTREKKGVKAEERLAVLYGLPCFDRLRKERPGLFEAKVRIIAGDIGEPFLGISTDDQELLIKSVNIVFHIAASVRFDDSLVKAVRLNLQSTKYMLDLAKAFHQLESFVHVSTAFSSSLKDCIEEVVHPPYADWREILEICKSLDSHTLEVLTHKYIEGMANTYVFTKHLAEHMVLEERGKLPIVIYRPSIVTPALKEPCLGWVDNFNGPVGVIIAGGKGILRTMWIKSNMVLDYIPVCSVVRGVIAVAWDRGTKKLEATDDIPIYNACDGGNNRVTSEEITKLGNKIMDDTPLDNMLWAPCQTTTNNFIIFYIRYMLFQLLPAILIDGLIRMFAGKPMLVKLQRKIFVVLIALRPFNECEWKFSITNFSKLCSKIKEQDRKEFDFVYKNFDIFLYYSHCVKGAKKFLLKEKEEDIPKSKIHHKRLLILDSIVTILLYGYIFWRIYEMVAVYLI